MDNRQTVCATLSLSHFGSLSREVEINGAERAIGNRMNGGSTKNAKRDVKAIREIDARNGSK